MTSKITPENKVEIQDKLRYAGFNVRLAANLIDTVLLFLITLPVMLLSQEAGYMTHPDYILQAQIDADNGVLTQQQYFEIMMPYINSKIPTFFTYALIDFVIVGAIFVAFWKWKNSTPGKLLFKLRIISDETVSNPTIKQYILRFIGYIVSTVTLFLGFFIIPFNKRKKGLHDYISGTSVIHLEPLDADKEKKIFKYKTIFFFITILLFAIFLATK